MYTLDHNHFQQITPWNKGKLIGQKRPLKLKEIWAIRIRLQMDNKLRELALSAVQNNRADHLDLPCTNHQ